MAAPDIKPDQIPPGELLRYFGDIASGAIRPEDVRFEELSFQVTIGPTGQILSQTPANGTVQIVSRYSWAIESVRGSAMNRTLAGAAPELVSFNMNEQGRNFSVFKRPIVFGTLVDGSCTDPMTWRGTYITIPGTQFQVDWAVNIALWPSFVGGTRVFTIYVGGSYIACSPTQQ